MVKVEEMLSVKIEGAGSVKATVSLYERFYHKAEMHLKRVEAFIEAGRKDLADAELEKAREQMRFAKAALRKLGSMADDVGIVVAETKVKMCD